MSKPKLGPTGKFPQGKMNEDDEGGIAIGITHTSTGQVVIDFGDQWIGMGVDEARLFSKSILEHADLAEKHLN